MGSKIGARSCPKPKLSKICQANLGYIRHSCNELLAAIEMRIETFYLCIFSRERGWDGQRIVSKEKGEH